MNRFLGPTDLPRGLVAAALTITLFVLAQVGCGGGGASNTINPPPPPSSSFSEIDAPGASNGLFLGTTAQAIDGNGDVAGSDLDASNNSHGFLRPAGQSLLTTFDAPGAGSASSGNEGTYVQGINSSATIVGWVIDAQRVGHGYTRTSSGTFTTFDVPGSTGTMPFGINDNGVVTGEFLDANQFAHGFVRATDGTFNTFDAPGATFGQYSGTIPARINASGTVVGTFQGASGVLHGFLRAPDGTLTTIDAPGATQQAGSGTQAQDINDSGVVVGLLYGPLFNGTGHRSFVRDAAGNYTVFDPPGVGPPRRATAAQARARTRSMPAG